MRLFAIVLALVRGAIAKGRGFRVQLWGLKRSGKHTMIESSCEVRKRECDRVPRYENEAFRRGPRIRAELSRPPL